jgi:hypothetical protein
MRKRRKVSGMLALKHPAMFGEKSETDLLGHFRFMQTGVAAIATLNHIQRRFSIVTSQIFEFTF